MATDFILNRTNVKAINVIDKNGIATGLRKVVDQYDNVLWRGMIETNFSDVFLYITNGAVIPNNIRVGGTYVAHYDLLNSETGEELYYYSEVTENRYVKSSQYGSKIYVNSDVPIPEAYEGYYYGVELIFSGYDDGTNLYDSCYYDFMFSSPIKSASLDYGSGWIIYDSSTDRFTADSSDIASDYNGYMTSWKWTWKLFSSPFNGHSDGYTIQTSPISTKSSSYLTKAAIISELKSLSSVPDTISDVYPNGPYYLYVTYEAKTNLLDPDYDPDEADEDDDGYVSLYKMCEYKGTITIPYAWSSVTMMMGVGRFDELAIFRASSKSKTVMKNATLSGRFSLYADGTVVKNDIAFSAPYKDSGNVTDISAGSGWYDEYDNYAYISTGVEPDYGRTYKGIITIPETAGWEAYSGTFEKVLKPFEYEWGHDGTDGISTEPKLCLGSQVNYWPTTTPQYSNHVYVAVYDYPNGSATTSMSFSGKLQIYRNNSYYTTVTFSASKPNSAGNLILDTGITYDPNIDYKVILTVDPGYKNGFKGLDSYEVTRGNADMRGTSVDVSLISGASVTYITGYGSTSTYGARIFFNALATYTVRVTIVRRTIGSSSWSSWRVYSIFVNDGNMSWSDKATMLIDTNNETTGAWYYKNSSQYGIEIGLDSGYEYCLNAVTIDSNSYYSSILLSIPSSPSAMYKGTSFSPSEAFPGSDWSVTGPSTYPITVGSYSYTLTKKSSLRIWSDDYTRLKSTKTKIFSITKAYWTLRGDSLSNNETTGSTTAWERGQVLLRVYDYPNMAASYGRDLPYVSWELRGYKSGYLTPTAIIQNGTLLASGSGYAKLYNTDDSYPPIGISSSSGNILIETGYTGENLDDMDVRAIVTIGSTNNMQQYTGSGSRLYTAKLTVSSKYTKVSKPSATTSFTYNGSSHMAFSSATGYTASGSGTNAGIYTTTATLNSGYCWSDGTTSPYSVSFTINKASISILDSLKVRKSGSSYEWWIDLASSAYKNTFTVTKKRYDSTSTSKPSSSTNASETVTANSNGNLTGTFKPKSTYVWLDVTVKPSSNNSNFTGSASASSGRKKVSSITTTWG